MPTRKVKTPQDLGLPRRPYLYTIDQIADLLSLTETVLKVQYVYYRGRSVGRDRADLISAVQVAPCGCGREDWRVEEAELVRWMLHMGFKAY